MSEVENIKEVEQVKEEVKDPVLSKIDSLKMSDDMKDKMRFIHAHYTGKKLGFPAYDEKVMLLNWKMNSFLAFFFSVIYYPIKGLWRKCVTLTVISTLVSIPFIIMNSPDFIYKLIGCICSVYMSANAYYDIYRKEVLNEKFWW